MTGFASVECELPHGSFRVELRSVNHRALDLQIRIPRAFQVLDSELKGYLTKRIGRGSVEFRIENREAANHRQPQRLPSPTILAPLMTEIQDLNAALGFTHKLTFHEAIRMLSQFGTLPSAAEGDKIEAPKFETLLPTIDRVLEAFLASRLREGTHLVSLLNANLALLRKRTEALLALRQVRDQGLARRVQDKVEAVLKHAVEQAWLESRIAQELALIADRADIEEELGRIDHHLSTFEAALRADQTAPIGRKLEFVLQELNREYTTLSNKAQDAKLQTEAVECKLLLEQLREQVLNLA